MRLRTKMLVAALGVATLSFAVAAPAHHTVQAAGFHLVSDDDDDNTIGFEEGGEFEGGGGDGGSGGGWDGGGSEWEGVPDQSGPGATDPGMPMYQLPEVTVIGHSLGAPALGGAPPAIPIPGGPPAAVPGIQVLGKGQVEETRNECMQNTGGSEVKVSHSVSYSVSYQVTATLSANAASLLSASLSTQLNTSITRTTQLEVTVPAGGTFALYTQYQMVAYRIVWTDAFGQVFIEYTNVLQPTGVTRVGSC